MADVIGFQTYPPVTVGTFYVVLRNNQGMAWRTDTSSFESFSNADMSLYALFCTDEGSSGLWTTVWPAVPNGIYQLVGYKQLGGSPSVTDAVQAEGQASYPETATVVCPTVTTDCECSTPTLTTSGSSFLDTLAYDAINVFCNDFAESVIYTPYEGTPKTYQAVIFREIPVVVAGLDGASSYKFELYLPNDASGVDGPATINKGKDQVTLMTKVGVGVQPQSFVVLQIVQSDEGMWHLGIGAK